MFCRVWYLPSLIELGDLRSLTTPRNWDIHNRTTGVPLPRSQVGRSGRSLWNDPREKLCGQRERIESRESGDMGWIPALPPLARCKIACCSSCLFILCKPEGEGRGEADRQKGLRRLWPPGYCERWFLFYELIGPRYAISWRIKNKKQQLHLLSAQCHVRWSHTATYTHK